MLLPSSITAARPSKHLVKLVNKPEADNEDGIGELRGELFADMMNIESILVETIIYVLITSLSKLSYSFPVYE